MGKRCSDDSGEEVPRKRASQKCALEPGEILTDLSGKDWKLGKRIGTGGFGVIFLASDQLDEDVGSNAKHICKVEDYENGPLFVERNCYLRIAKPDMVTDWKANHNMNNLGMPHYVASGSHETRSAKYRFLIIPRYDCDLEQVFNSKGKRFNVKTVCKLAIQILDILEYIHHHGYVHSDIKASNLLLSKTTTMTTTTTTTTTTTKSPSKMLKGRANVRYHGSAPMRSCRLKKLPKISRNLRPNSYLKELDLPESPAKPTEAVTEKEQIYLVDFGLATKYLNADNSHKPYCRDERKAHAGTILFCSIDAHIGAQSRRSDLESLGYNIVYWLTGNLPWEEDFDNAELVQKKKTKCLNNLKEFLMYMFKDYPKFIHDYFSHLRKLDFCEQPNYNYYKNLFKNAIIEHGYGYGYKNDNSFDFDNRAKCVQRLKRANIENKHQNRVKSTKLVSVRLPFRTNVSVKPKQRKLRCQKHISWSKILIDPEDLMKKQKERKSPEIHDVNYTCNLHNLDLGGLNPTPAMIGVYNRSRQKHVNPDGCAPRNRGDFCLPTIEGYTPAMMAVLKAKKQRREMEYQQIVETNRSHQRAESREPRKTKYIKRKIKPMITRSINHHTTRSEMTRLSSDTSLPRIYRLRG